MTAALVLVAGPVRADAGAVDDIQALERQLTEEHAALSTADCNAACRALASIRRATEKICTLEPGPRCDSARDKAADATRRVRDVCPDCIIPAPPEPAPSPERAVTGTADHRVPASAPYEAEARGGCRSCASTGEGPMNDLGAIVLAVFAVVRLAGRRSKEDRQGV